MVPAFLVELDGFATAGVAFFDALESSSDSESESEPELESEDESELESEDEEDELELSSEEDESLSESEPPSLFALGEATLAGSAGFTINFNSEPESESDSESEPETVEESEGALDDFEAAAGAVLTSGININWERGKGECTNDAGVGVFTV